MATKEELLKQFMLDQQRVIKESEERSNQRPLVNEKAEDEIQTIELVIGASEKVKEYKGYFVTDPTDNYLRKVPNVRLTGCSGKVYNTIGNRSMDIMDYSESIDDESKELIIKFNSLWDKFMSYDESLRKEATKIPDENGALVPDTKFFSKKIRNYYIFYMYLVEGPGIDKPDYYLMKTKSSDFSVAKATAISKQIKTMKECNADPTPFALEMFDNSTPKKRLVTLKLTRPSGYSFDIDTTLMDSEFKLPEEGLAKLKPLSEMYINESEIDKDRFRTNIKVLATWISKMQNTAKPEVKEIMNDPFED